MTSILDELERAEKAATKGPWRIGVGGKDDGRRSYGGPHVKPFDAYSIEADHVHGSWPRAHALTAEDALFISLLRNAAPALIAVCKLAKEIVCEVRDKNPTKVALIAALAKLKGVGR